MGRYSPVSGSAIPISAPGLMAWVSRIQRTRFSGVFSKIPAASEEREARLVRFGPSTPTAAGLPEMAWQAMQPLDTNNCAPACAASLSAAGGCSMLATQPSNSPGGTTRTRKRMFACEVPQNSAHWP